MSVSLTFPYGLELRQISSLEVIIMEKLEMSELRRQINTVMQRVVNSQDRIDAKELKLLQKKEIEMSKI